MYMYMSFNLSDLMVMGALRRSLKARKKRNTSTVTTPNTFGDALTAEMFKAAENNDSALIRKALERGASYNAQNDDGETIIHAAYRTGGIRSFEVAVRAVLRRIYGSGATSFEYHYKTRIDKKNPILALMNMRNNQGLTLWQIIARQADLQTLRVINIHYVDVRMRDMMFEYMAHGPMGPEMPDVMLKNIANYMNTISIGQNDTRFLELLEARGLTMADLMPYL